jgi:hypothetical protein
MSCLLFLEDEEALSKVNIDELYEKDHRRDQKQLSIFNKILNRIHKRITTTSRNKKAEKYAWFTVPEYIFGEPVYNKGDCIAFLITKLEMNGFFIKYMHPNTLFISWEKWVPSYVRHELKKKMGVIVDEKGNIIENQDSEDNPENINNKILNDKKDEDIIIGAILLAGELRFIKNGSKLHMNWFSRKNTLPPPMTSTNARLKHY